MNKIVSVVILLLFHTLASAENFCRVRDFSMDNGLLQAHISNAVQDQAGFIWFATWNGLVRFDGNTFYTFKPVQNSGGTIFSNRIYNIKRSANPNGLWCVSSENKLYYFDLRSCQFSDILGQAAFVKDKRVKVLTPLRKCVTWVTFKDQSCLRLEDNNFQESQQYYPVGDKALMGANHIIGIKQDEQGYEWILTDRGAICITRHLQIKGLFHYVESIGSHVFLIGKDGMVVKVDGNGKSSSVGRVSSNVNYAIVSDDLLLLATDTGIWSYDARRKTFAQYQTGQAIFLYKDAKRRIWAFGHGSQVCMLNPQADSLTILETARADKGCSMKNPQMIMEDSRGTVILKPERGVLSCFDEETSTLQPCRFFKGYEEVFYEPTDISKFFVDHQHNLWILKPHAAECISFTNTSFYHWTNASHQETRAIFRDSNGNEWLTDRSLCLYQRERGYLSPSGRWQSLPISFTKMPVYCITEDREHRLWVGTKGDGLYILTPQAGGYRVAHFLNEENCPTSLRSDTIYSILPTKEGKVLLGSYGQGLSVAQETPAGDWQFSQVKDFPANTKIRCMSEATKGIFLIGTTGGLITADLRNPARPHYYHNMFRKEEWGLKGNDIMSLLCHDGQWYACVFGSGVSHILSTSLTSDSIHFRNYLIPPTATADQIKTAATDGHYIWLMSEQAVTRFTPSTGDFNIYDHTHFIGDFHFAEGQPIVNGKHITAGVSDGLLVFQTDAIGSRNQQPRLVLTGIQYQNDMAIHALNDLHHLELIPDERSFSLYFSALDYEGQDAIRYRYCMEGYDNGWNYTVGSQHAANYSSLPPGDYVLTIQATNGDGFWDKNTRQITVHVVPRFVETVWFKLVILLLIVAAFLAMAYTIVYLGHMRRLLQRKYSLLMTVDEFSRDIRIEREVEEQQRIAEDEQQFMKANITFFEDNIANRNFVVEDMARHLGMSRTAYYNKMKSITGLSPIDFIKQMRIKKALKLMEDKSLSISDIAYRVGFSDPKYFSKCFKAEMGMSPTQYINGLPSSHSQ